MPTDNGKTRQPRAITLARKQAEADILAAHLDEVNARVAELMADAGYRQETVTRWAK